ncbi:MAG TPA: hypothetical protein VL128_07915 [Candidatus Eisenbacteria bacterium]|nr:hypothetical protein [Candidatus Eisenbacteria bacterium]
MRSHNIRCLLLTVATLTISPCADSQKHAPRSTLIQNAKTVYFENQTGSDATGDKALDELRKWGRFKIVGDKKSADLILLLSASPYRGGNILLASGQTGSIENGQLKEDKVPNYTAPAPTREAYLTVIDPGTGASLWKGQHAWGGLLTGYNSAGARLVRKLKSDMKR